MQLQEEDTPPSHSAMSANLPLIITVVVASVLND